MHRRLLLLILLLLVHDQFVLQHLLCLLREVRWVILLLATATVDDNVAASEQMCSILLGLLHCLRLGIRCVMVVTVMVIHLLLLQLQLLLSPNLLAVKVLLALWLGLVGMGGLGMVLLRRLSCRRMIRLLLVCWVLHRTAAGTVGLLLLRLRLLLLLRRKSRLHSCYLLLSWIIIMLLVRMLLRLQIR